MDRIKQLEKEIMLHDQLYWSGNAKISDYEYDSLVEELKKLDPNNELLTKINGEILVNTSKVYHKKPMLSLDKVYNHDDLFDWVKNKSRNENECFLIQPKYDGLSGKLQINDNTTILSTRGNGFIGEDITNKLPIIELITDKQNIEQLYGEILITKDDFLNKFSKILSPTTQKPYKNSRNAVSGIIGSDDIGYFVQNNIQLKLIDYDKNSYEVTASCFEKEWENIVQKISKMPYPMDGIVVKIKDQKYFNELGNTAHHPRGSIAYKFSNPKAKSTLINVEWSFGKNFLTPVAIIQPVEINGVTVERVSLANYENVKKMNIHIGDVLQIERAGDVIPHVINVIHNNSQQSVFIDNCPCCGSQLVIDKPQIFCPNEQCKEKIIRKMLFSIKTIGVDGIGIPTIRKIIDELNINNLYEFMQITLMQLNKIGFGQKTSENIFNAINNAKIIKDYQFLTCLNINDVGDEISKLILSEYSIEDLMQIKNPTQLVKIKGIGLKTAKKITQYFKENLQYVILLRSLFFVQTETPFSNIKGTVCFTGAMQKPRKYYEQLAIEKNFKPIDTVNKDLMFLVTNDINSQSSKIKKAQKYGIDIITIEEFLDL